MEDSTSTLTDAAGSQSKTVTFDVGGTIYRVSRSLLEQHPDTMLARMASDTWFPEGSNQGHGSTSGSHGNRALFLERNGERFQHVLDYMRDGGMVTLPPTVSKDALLRDLAYYGFVDVDPSQISESESLQTFEICHNRIVNLLHDFQNKRQLYKLAEACLFLIRQEGKLGLRVLSHDFLSGERMQILSDILLEVDIKPERISFNTLELSNTNGAQTVNHVPDNAVINRHLRNFERKQKLIELAEFILSSYTAGRSLRFTFVPPYLGYDIVKLMDYDPIAKLDFEAIIKEIGLKLLSITGKCSHSKNEYTLVLEHL